MNIQTSILKQDNLIDSTVTNVLEKIEENPNLVPYFVTVTYIDFDKLSHHQKKTESAIELMWSRHEKIHRHITANMLKNFTKKPHLHPIAFDFVDVPGTRQRANIDLYNSRSFHSHGIWLLDKSIIEKWDALISDDFKKITTHNSMRYLESIHAERVPIDELKKTVSYATKLFDYGSAQRMNLSTPLYHALPRSMSERSTKPKYFIQ